MTCPAFDPRSDYIPGLTGFIDCRVHDLGEQGFLALSAPGSFAASALTGLLTLFVAFAGYRLLLGEAPGVRGIVLLAARLGMVLALTTQWPAYQTVIYRVIIDGPAQIAARLGAPDDLTARLQKVYLRLDGAAEKNDTPAEPAPVSSRTQAMAVSPQPRDNPLKPASLAFLTEVAGSLAGARIAAGILLALGPLFVAFLLFDGTRGLFEGWLRGLGATAIATVATTLVLDLQLAVMEPQAAALTDAGRLPGEILVTTLVFAVALVLALSVSILVAAGLRLPSWRRVMEGWLAHLAPATVMGGAPARDTAPPSHARPSHAHSVVEAARAAQRRDEPAGSIHVDVRSRGNDPTAAASSSGSPFGHGQPRSQRRTSASHARRDEMT